MRPKRENPNPHQVTTGQWLAAIAVWALALYGLLAAPKNDPDVRFAQATVDGAACHCVR